MSYAAGIHAIVLTGSIRALRERDARLGGTRGDDRSFPLTGTDTSARRRMFRVAWASRSRHPPRWPRTPQSHTLPVDAVKSVATSADEQERLVFVSTPSQHDTAQIDRPIFESFAEALHVALGRKIG